MADIVLVATACAFFGLCSLYIRGCEQIIRRDDIDTPSLEPTGNASEQP